MTWIRYQAQEIAFAVSFNLLPVFVGTMVISLLAVAVGLTVILLGGPLNILTWGAIGFIVSLIALVGCLVGSTVMVGDVSNDR